MKRRWNVARWVHQWLGSRKTPAAKPESAVRPWLEWLEGRWLPSSFTVTDNSDDPADGNSLRYALNHLTAGGNTIEFNIAGSTTIAVGSVTGTPLPAISEPVAI